jgi:hypothetical protein
MARRERGVLFRGGAPAITTQTKLRDSPLPPPRPHPTAVNGIIPRGVWQDPKARTVRVAAVAHCHSRRFVELALNLLVRGSKQTQATGSLRPVTSTHHTCQWPQAQAGTATGSTRGSGPGLPLAACSEPASKGLPGLLILGRDPISGT